MRRRGFYSLLSPGMSPGLSAKLSAGIVVIAAALAVLILSGRSPIPSPPPKPVFPGLAERLGELAWARIARGAAKIDFANVAGRWVVIEKDNYPADPARIQRLLHGLADLTLIEPKPPAA